MKVTTPEISWHGKDAVFSIDVQRQVKGQPRRLATAGLDTNVRIWQLLDNEVKFLSNLSRHDKAVNIVRFSNSGHLLASAGDDGTIVLWKLTDKEETFNIFDSENGKNVEVWCALKILRGHLEDINDLSWSGDDVFIVSGSVDHSAILWDVEKGQKLSILSESKHFVNGVAWDPLGKYVATMSCDRSLRVYNANTKKMIHCVSKMSLNKDDSNSEISSQKPQRIFHDETVVRRRLCFTVDGKLLITPAGCLRCENQTPQQVNTAMIFPRGNLSKPVVYLPGFTEPPCIVACCPVLFQPRTLKEGKKPTFKLEYRHLFAVASTDTILLYDTQQSTPFALISNIHYASITDLRWSPDASFLVLSSRDGFCSVISFDEGELGLPYKAETVAEKQVTQDSTADNKQSTADVKISIEEAPVSMSVEEAEAGKTKADELKAGVQLEEVPMEVDENNAVVAVETDDNGKTETLNKEDKEPVKSVESSNAIPLSVSPKPRRVTLTTLSTNASSQSPAFPTQQMGSKPSPLKPVASAEKKNAPRRIQLTPVLVEK